MRAWAVVVSFFQAEDGIRDVERSRGLGDVYKRQDIFFKFLRMIDKGLKFIPIESQVSSSKCAEAR